MNDAAYQSILMQNHRLRVQLMLERKGISTLNMGLKALQYINDGFKVGMLPDQLAEGLETLMPMWVKDDAKLEIENAKAKLSRALQSSQRKIH